MKYWLHYLYGALLTVAAGSAIADAPERVLWNKRPIKVHIQINQERIIHFPDEVRYWLPDSIKHKVSALAANGVLYIRALESFPATRIRVQDLDDQQVYLLDVSANDVANASDELIVMTGENTLNKSRGSHPQKSTEDWRIRLTRYAAQKLYAPERLLSGDHAIKRIPLSISTPVPLIRGGLVEAVPVAAWRANRLTVTAVKLRNTSPQQLRLQFEGSEISQVLNLSRLIRGNWLTVALQHNYLGAAGKRDDTTSLYLVSEQSFAESLDLVIPVTELPEKPEESNDG